MIKQCVAGACMLLGMEPLAVFYAHGYLEVLIDLPANMSLSEFVCKLKALSPLGDYGNTARGFPPQVFWKPGYLVSAISPEDKAEATIEIVTGNTMPARYSNLPQTDAIESDVAKEEFRLWHHLIICTANASMKLPLKHATNLECAVNSIATELGAAECKSAAMRNHIHILFAVSDGFIPESFAKSLMERLQQWMKAEPQSQFRTFVGWHDDWIIYTVSHRRLTEENNNLLSQPYIHRRNFSPNEMSFIYRRLDIPFVFQLK